MRSATSFVIPDGQGTALVTGVFKMTAGRKIYY